MATPETFRPLDIAPHLRLLPSAGITRLQRYYGPLRHPVGPTSPSRAVGWRVPRHQTGLPVLRSFSCSMRAAANTPAKPVGACVARFPTGGSLPRFRGGSASALSVSGPARRSLTLRPAWSLSHPWRPVVSECFRRVVTFVTRSDCYRLERQLPGGIRTRCRMAPFHGARENRSKLLAATAPRQ